MDAHNSKVPLSALLNAGALVFYARTWTILWCCKMASHCGSDSSATQRGPWHWHSCGRLKNWRLLIKWFWHRASPCTAVVSQIRCWWNGLILPNHRWLEGSRCCKNASFVYSWNWPHLAGSKPNVTFQNGFLIARVASLLLLNLAINPQLLLFTLVRSTLLRIDLQSKDWLATRFWVHACLTFSKLLAWTALVRAVSLQRESISPARANIICPSVSPCILSDHSIYR